jgi:hypothetical protein
MSSRRPLSALLLLAASSLAGCISVRERETRAVDAAAMARRNLERQFSDARVGSLQVRSLVFKPRELPLSDFLAKIAHGDYRTALKVAHLRYAPSNIDDAAIRTLVREGFVPVLVEITNAGTAPADLRRVALALDDDGRSLEPIPNDSLPRLFEALNPKAMAANVYNTGAVVIGSVAVVVTVAGTLWAECMDDRAKNSPLDLPYILDDMLKAFDGDLYNAATKTTIVDYSGLLWSAPTIPPGGAARGLLFFRKNDPDWEALRLKASVPASWN